ncbi:MAG: HD domain-containing phosphohydrolase [Deltaproteobacteria bacterium]
MQTFATTVDGIRIMLVDDEDSVREVLTEILSRRGWSVQAFSSAETAIVELKGNNYDIIIADVSMPGLSGIEFLKIAKQASPEVPVVIITGYPSIDLAVEAMKSGAVDFIAKPFKAEEIEIVVRKAVAGAKVTKSNDPDAGAHAIRKLPELARRRLEDKIKELSILHTIGESIDEVSQKDAIFEKTLDIAQIIADSDRSFIMVVEQDARALVVRAESGFEGPGIMGLAFSAQEEPFKSVIRNRCYSYMLVGNANDGPLAAIFSGMNNGCKRVPLLLAPMLMNRETVLILGIVGREGAADLSEDAITLLMNLCTKASLKLENIALSENIFSSIIGALNSLINALDARDTYTKDHSNRVTQYALKLAKAMECPQEMLDSISFAGPLHDIGKIGVRDDILLKKGIFSADEKEIIKNHVTRGEEILRPLNLMPAEKAIVLYHHERWDGAGYPTGLRGANIPLVARIFSVADTLDAMTSTRPYRSALSIDVTRAEILKCRGTQFDPSVVDAFFMSDILKGC